MDDPSSTTPRNDTRDDQAATDVDIVSSVVLSDLDAILTEFPSMFEAPHGLQPARDNDYAIHLQPHASPVNVRPYCYPYFQKSEVERQVQHMLAHQLIRKTLNVVTVRDKFPIPTAEELFDELGSSTYFSKLDLLAGYTRFGYEMMMFTRRPFEHMRATMIDPSKVEAISKWPVPTNLKEVRGFLGIAGYYPHAAMDQLKQSLSSTQVLGRVETDASGKLNNVADALSREHDDTFLAFSRPILGIVEAIRAACGLLLWRNIIMVPDETALRTLLLREFHNSVIGGHAGVTRTFHRLAAGFYWPGMRKDVRRFVAECQVFEDISLDFIVGLPKSNGKEAILVVVDRLTKYAHFFSLPRHFDSAFVAKILVQGVIKLHGIPRTIFNDCDRLFLSDMWTELARLQQTKLCFSSAYHPQSDGQTEALNRCLEMYLRCMTGDDPNKWDQYLAWAEYWYNTAYHTSAGMTPFRALYGRDPPTVLTYLEGSSRNTHLDQQLLERDELLRVLKGNLLQAQQRMKLQADKHHRELTLEEGSWAFV
ncbi:hypothetical protein GQ457_14G014840 [Hibiscus cannabinus]